MVRRTFTAVLLLAIVLPAVFFGGVLYFVLVAAFIGLAAIEYVTMLSLRDVEPTPAGTFLAVLALLGARAFWPELAPLTLSMVVLGAMVLHLWRYERGRDRAPIDLAAQLLGSVYLGWIGAYLIDLRSLENGLWWLLYVFIVVWAADSAAYFIGARFGRHRLAPRLSPKKSWEGYIAGVAVGTAVGVVVAEVLSRIGPIQPTLFDGLSLGLVLAALTTLGDLGESLFKRFSGVKDSGKFLPGHGGAFDRIDSLLWAGVIGYYWITFFTL